MLLGGGREPIESYLELCRAKNGLHGSGRRRAPEGQRSVTLESNQSLGASIDQTYDNLFVIKDSSPRTELRPHCPSPPPQNGKESRETYIP